MRKKWLARLVCVLFGGLAILSILNEDTFAQGRRGRGGGQSTTVSAELPENQRPWSGGPWIAAAVMSVAVVLVSCISAKRSHLD